MRILWVFETDVFIVQKGFFSMQNVGNRFFTIHFYDLLHGDRVGYKGLQGITKEYGKLVFQLERPQILFLGLFCITIKLKK